MKLSLWCSSIHIWSLAVLGQSPPPNATDDTAFYGLSPPVYPSPLGQGTGIWANAYLNAQELVSQMTLDEKANITRGFAVASNACSGNTGSVPRLGWPGMCLQDAGNGVRATDFVNAYPSGMHAGASWDKRLTYRRGFAMGGEFRIKGANIALGPMAGPLGRVPLGGRNWEGFSIDPYLTGILTAETIKGTQDAGTIACLKHYIANEQETLRRPYGNLSAASSNIDDKTLHEFYLWPFMDGVHAGVGSVMCSYNRINNSYGCQNSDLMNGILKTELSFQGFVLSDWNAQHSGVGSALAGMDMVMPYGGFWGDNLTDAVKNGSVPEERVTDMATRIVASWYLAGQDNETFPEPGIGIQNLTSPHQVVDARDPKSKDVLMEGAIAGHVLLKNTRNALPLQKPKMLSLFGYDTAAAPTKNTDILFQLGYYSEPEMALATLGTEQHFAQYASSGTIIAGGRSGSNAPAFISTPFDAITQRARADDTFLNWDFTSPDPDVNPSSSACLVFINAMATEGWDRSGLHDDFSDALVLNVASKCPNTIVVIHNAGIRLVDQWIENPNVTGTIMAHLPGQESGEALVKILYGDVSPSGKLPYTLAKNESDYRVYEPCVAEEGVLFPQCDYTEGVYLDYRDFDARNITPRYEFGFGMSYTTFGYSSLFVEGPWSSLNTDQINFTKRDNSSPLWSVVAQIQVTITNTGSVPAAEVAQLYLGIPNSPSKQLRGFEKLPLGPGESDIATFDLTRRDISVWSVEEQRWVVQKGRYSVYVGASSRDIRLSGSFEVLNAELGG
ncbi:probable beta-glucosidase precursor [Phialocephala subalpina]|uniref:beta-glucosidase n=1 Tax=Phialocephala subalpina TaxID=576137 RepID=A0A1L7XC40_9HELO|nr:probable beta-glucosidase precursor [Phialocephala subalpina]